MKEENLDGVVIIIQGKKEGTLKIHSRAFGSSPFGLPVVVAGAHLLVAIGSRRHTQAFRTTLLAEEQTWLLVLCV